MVKEYYYISFPYAGVSVFWSFRIFKRVSILCNCMPTYSRTLSSSIIYTIQLLN